MVEDVQHNRANYSFLKNPRAAALLGGTCKRLLYNERVRMKDTASGAAALFHTAFTFQITGLDYFTFDAHGDGLALTFESNNNFTGQGGGKSLCLLSFANNGQASNRLFAVEFDTFLNCRWNNTSDNHIGVDINSVNSTWSYNLCGRTVRKCLYLCNGGYFTAWINYNAQSHKLVIFLQTAQCIAMSQSQPNS